MIVVYSMKQDMRRGMEQALSCDLSIRAVRYFSSFLTFRVLGRAEWVKSFFNTP